MHMQQRVSIQPVRVRHIFYSEELYYDVFSITKIYFVTWLISGFFLGLY